MPDIVIAGGGFAAVWTAAAAARRAQEAGLDPGDLSITVVAPGEEMVIRPRLYEEHPEEMRVALHRIFEPIGVEHVRAIVERVDTERSEVVAVEADGARVTLPFKRAVVATGSRVVRPTALPGADLMHDIDTLPAAVALDRHLHALPSMRAVPGRYTVVVIGAGFAGIELATELVGRLHSIAAPHGAESEVRVILVEREPTVGPELGPGPRPAIEAALDELGVLRRLNSTVAGFDGAIVRLDDGTMIPALTAVWTAGMRASAVAQTVPGPHDELGRIEVDSEMRALGARNVFAAGDTASAEVAPGHRALQACQYAHQMGKFAGHNAASDVLGLPLVAFAPDPYVTCVDLGASGAVYTAGFERQVKATGEDAKAIKRTINRRLIYPTVDDAAAILERADYMTASRPPQPVVRQAPAA
jgi:NADH:ubiquinone reductase (H+-translocating)